MGYWYDIKARFFIDDKPNDALKKLAVIDLPDHWQYAEGDVAVGISHNAYYFPELDDEEISATKLTVFLRDEGRSTSSFEELVWFHETAKRLEAKEAVFRFSPDWGDDEVFKWPSPICGQEWDDFVEEIKEFKEI